MIENVINTTVDKMSIWSELNTLFQPDTTIAWLLSAVILKYQLFFWISFNVLMLNAYLSNISVIKCGNSQLHFRDIDRCEGSWSLWSWWEDRGGRGGPSGVFAWLSIAQACLCDSRKTDIQGTALRPSLRSVPALPLSLAFAVLPYPLFPFPSPSLLMICSACRCLADWCPLTAPLMRKGCTPPPLHTHTDTRTHAHTLTE